MTTDSPDSIVDWILNSHQPEHVMREKAKLIIRAYAKSYHRERTSELQTKHHQWMQNNPREEGKSLAWWISYGWTKVLDAELTDQEKL